jgi:hypothetical protein
MALFVLWEDCQLAHLIERFGTIFTARSDRRLIHTVLVHVRLALDVECVGLVMGATFRRGRLTRRAGSWISQVGPGAIYNLIHYHAGSLRKHMYT